MNVSFEIKANIAGCSHTHVTANVNNGQRLIEMAFSNSDLALDVDESEVKGFTLLFLRHLAKQNGLNKAGLRTYLVGKTFQF